MKKLSAGQWQAFYRDESRQYDERRYQSSYGRLFARLHHELIADRLGDLPTDGRLLEIACGTGHVTGLLQHLGFSPVACDLTPEMMGRARERCSGRTPVPSFVRANAFRLPFASGGLDAIVTTRFLHLFGIEDQRRILDECARVLRPGGLLLVDFDNLSAHRAMALPHVVYNLLRYRRLAADTHYNSPAEVRGLLEASGFAFERCDGVGGTHLLPFVWLSERLALGLGRLHRRAPLRLLAEQFLVVARKS